MIAVLIDYFVIGSIFTLPTLCDGVLPNWFWSLDFRIGAFPVSLPSIGFFLLLLCITCKDFLFRNASLGKMILKLQIVDCDGEIPRVKAMLKRGLLMPTWGYITWIRSFFVSGFDIIQWEAEHFGTQVIEKRRY